MDEIAVKTAIAGAKLTIDIVPDTCVITRVRDHLLPAEWQAIAKAYVDHSNSICQICGSEIANDCQEVWQFNDETIMLTLTGFQTVCSGCFRVRYVERSSAPGEVQFAVFYLARINGWSEELSRFYINVCFRVWDKRSEMDWSMDLSFIKRNFKFQIVVKQPPFNT